LSFLPSLLDFKTGMVHAIGLPLGFLRLTEPYTYLWSLAGRSCALPRLTACRCGRGRTVLRRR
jgi:hypothetical protein